MRFAKKKQGTITQAFRLGNKSSEVIDLLSAQGKLAQIDCNTWRVFSQESTTGEICYAGDYIKLDSNNTPYPNKKSFFESNHRLIKGDLYEQVPRPVKIWTHDDSMCDEIQFLIEHKGLTINSESEWYYTAPLWGDILHADKNAIIILYDVIYQNGKIKDIDFSFISFDEFQKNYTVISE